MITNKNSLSVAAVVVTFNRKKLLLECLNSLKNQTRPPDAIFIVDGPSTDGTPILLKEKGFIKEIPPPNSKTYSWKTENSIRVQNGRDIRVVYIRLYKDIGGAGGFYEGMKTAYEDGYDWIWLMDDDAEPKEDALEKLLKYTLLPNTVALTPLQVDPEEHFAGHRGIFVNGNFLDFIPIKWSKNQEYVEIHHSSFVGPLIHRKAIKEIGLPRKEFFIWYDDVEYSLRLIKIGKIYMITSAVIVHKESTLTTNIKIKKFGYLKKWNFIPYEKFWKMYFKYRNWAYVGKRYSSSHILFIKRLLKDYIGRVEGIMLFDDHKWKRLHLLSAAYLDGLFGVFDNAKPKRILYGGKKK